MSRQRKFVKKLTQIKNRKISRKGKVNRRLLLGLKRFYRKNQYKNKRKMRYYYTDNKPIMIVGILVSILIFILALFFNLLNKFPLLILVLILSILFFSEIYTLGGMKNSYQ